MSSAAKDSSKIGLVLPAHVDCVFPGMPDRLLGVAWPHASEFFHPALIDKKIYQENVV
jgi:hypothetical protein